MFQKKPLRDCLLALGVWLLMVLTISPYPKPRLDTSTHYHAFAIYAVNLALGLEYRGLYPCCSPPALKQHWAMQINDPQTLIHADLRQLFAKEAWPQQQTFIETFRGGDIGMILFVQGVWRLTDTYNIAVVIMALQLLHLGSALLLFLLLCRLLRWVAIPTALIITLLYTYSAAMTRSVVDYTYYPFTPIVLIIAAFLLSLLLKPRRPAVALATAFCIGLVLAVGSYLRATIFYALLPIVLVTVAITWQSLPQGAGRRLALLTAFCLLIGGFGGRAVLDKFIWQESWRAANQTTAHSFWHPIWCGLGEFSNPYGFQWEDRAAEDFVKAREPSAAYASPAYERVLRDAILQSLMQDPLWVMRTIARRAWNLTGRWVEFLPGIELPMHARSSTAIVWFARLFLLCGFVGFIISMRQPQKSPLGLFVAIFAFDALMPLLIYSNNYYYNLTTYLAITMMVVVGFSECVRKVARLATLVS